jgi:hypothetical protein
MLNSLLSSLSASHQFLRHGLGFLYEKLLRQ